MKRAGMRLALVVMITGMAAPARTQTFSPGELARPHAALEGLENCKKCHVAAGQPGPAPCLACHRELEKRITAGTGFHGRMQPAERQVCNRCHPEHQGRDFALVDFGPGGKERFAHERTGWPLAGKHAAQACAACHEPRRIRDADVRTLLAEQRGRRTYLGLGRACVGCHFDEHRGQEEKSCERCHDESGWKPARGFDHARTRFALVGQHARVACAKCHSSQTDTQMPRDAFPAPRAASFAKLEGIAHESCLDCHRDPHRGKLGRACDSCHTPETWRQMRQKLVDTGFHERTRYPLRGAHASVPCVECHGPFPEAPARYRGLAFDACTACHADAHGGQLGRGRAGDGGADAACERCHRVEGFVPVRFEIEDHAATRLPLAGAHRLVACSRCHRPERAAPAAVSPALERAARRGKVVALSPAVLHFDAPLDRCETCHADPHAGQLAAWGARGGCKSCHEVRSFQAVRFDHQKDSRFALTGKHEKVACSGCHRPDSFGEVTAVRYRGVTTACAGCHRDVHYGQLAKDGEAACERCHTTTSFVPALFSHAEARFTDFALEGRHAKVACAKCHPEIRIDARTRVRRYKPVPRACEDCHTDVHRGAFAGLDAEALARVRSKVKPSPGAPTRCAACHTPRGWSEVQFPHERTGFALRGRHHDTPCRSCHVRGFERPLADACSACHRDPHAGQLGLRCEGCHDPESWRSAFTADAHRGTAFPLVGRHAILPCTECHRERRDRGFGHTAVSCYDCHAADYQRTAVTGIDHVAAGFSTRCRECHSAWRFSPATFPAHDRCFDITGGPHGAIRCRSCHTSLPPTPQNTGACNTDTASCTRCHHCNEVDGEHRDVAGYQCKDRKCYECHRFTP